MTLTKFSILTVLIMLPLCFLWPWNFRQEMAMAHQRYQYESIAASALKDSAFILAAHNQEAYSINTQAIHVKADEVIATYLATYTNAMKGFGHQGMATTQDYVLALVVLSYDGFYLYGTYEVEVNGQMTYQRLISEKQLYYEEAEGYGVAYTMGMDLKIVSLDTFDYQAGDYSSLFWPYEIDAISFNRRRQKAIMTSVEKALEDQVNRHNRYTKNIEMGYEFNLPKFEGSDWYASLSKPGILAFVQGLPIGRHDHLAYAGLAYGDIRFNEPLAGYKDAATNRYYYARLGCPYPHEGSIIRVFTDEKEAAGSGFDPCSLLGK